MDCMHHMKEQTYWTDAANCIVEELQIQPEATTGHV